MEARSEVVVILGMPAPYFFGLCAAFLAGGFVTYVVVRGEVV